MTLMFPNIYNLVLLKSERYAWERNYLLNTKCLVPQDLVLQNLIYQNLVPEFLVPK